MATNIPFDYETDSTRLKRRQQFLEASLPSVLKAPQGQMIGNRYVGEGIAGALSRVLGAYFMGQEQRDIDADAAALKDRYNTAVSEGTQNYFDMANGKPAQYKSSMAPTVDNDPLNPKQVQTSPAIPADPRRAAQMAIASGLAPLQQLGMEELKEQAKSRVGAKDLLPYANPAAIPGMLTNGIQDFKPKANVHTVGDVAFDANTNGLIKIGAGQDGVPPSPTLRTIAGDLYQASPSTGQFKKLDSAPKVTVNTSVVNKGEGKFMEELGTASAKDLMAAKQAKVQAQRTIQSMAHLEQLDNAGVFSGPTANVTMTLGSLADAMGLPVDKRKLANSQAYQGELLSQLGNQLTGSLARSTTDKDMEILKAPLPELLNSPEGRAALRRQAVAKAQEHIQYANELHQNLGRTFPEAQRLLAVTPGTVAVPQRVDVPQGNGAPSVSNW